MQEDNSKWSELVGYVKDTWGVVSVLSSLFGPGALLLVPVVPIYRISSGFWAVAFSAFALLLIYQTLWKGKQPIACRWSVLPLVLLVVAGAGYSFLFDYLPVTIWPTQYPTLTQHALSVAYGLMFGFLTSTFALLRVCKGVH